MQAELDDLRRAQEEFEQEEEIPSDNQTTNHYTENHSLHHEGYHHHEDLRSPLLVTLQQVPWPQGYKLVELPKYNGSIDPTQFLMTYEVTIASAGGDDPIMACKCPVAN
jgi:hypothetical protein